jgi:hypothetical protein
MKYCAPCNRTRKLNLHNSQITKTVILVFIFLWCSYLEIFGALNAPTHKSIIKNVNKVYNQRTISPSFEKLIIEIQNTGPDLPYIYFKAGFIDEWLKSIDFIKFNTITIEYIKKQEELRFNNTLVAQYDLKRVLEEKFPNALVIVTFVPIEERIEYARNWPQNFKPISSPIKRRIYPPFKSEPKLPYADVIVQMDFNQFLSKWNGPASYIPFFDVTINAFTSDSSIIQFSTDYDVPDGMNKLQIEYESFNKPAATGAVRRIRKRKNNYSEMWHKRYEFDRVFYNNFPDDNSYWNYRAEELAHLRAAKKAQVIPRISYTTTRKFFKNYTSDYNTAPLYPLYIRTADAVEHILENTQWRSQRVTGIRNWAKYYETDESKIQLIEEKFFEAGSSVNDASVKRLHKLLMEEINSFKIIEREKLIDPALGDPGNLARETLKNPPKPKITLSSLIIDAILLGSFF